MDLRRQLFVLRKWIGVLAISTVLAAVAAYAASGLLPKVYEGKTVLIVGQALSAANPDYNQILTSQVLSQTYASIATTRPIMARVATRVGISILPEDLAKQVKVQAPRDQRLLIIQAQDSDPKRAAAIANALADELISASPVLSGSNSSLYGFIDRDLKATDKQISDVQAEVDQLVQVVTRTDAQDARLETLQGRLTSLRATYSALLASALASSPGLLTIVEPAEATAGPISPRPLFNAGIAGLLGLLVAIAVAFTVEHLDDTLKNAEDIEELLGLPTLGLIGRMRGHGVLRRFHRLVTVLYIRSPEAEAFRTLRTNIEFASLDAPARTLLVTSSAPGEGKTTVAANLAVVLAQSGRRTLLVDADLRDPGVNEMFTLPNTLGVTTLLRSDEVTIDRVAHESEVPNLRIITTGPLPPNPAELLGSHRMEALITRLMAAADVIVVDSPPVDAVTDAALLSKRVDGTLLVIRASRTRRATVRRGQAALARVNANVLGVVLNGVPERMGAEFYHGYHEPSTSPAPLTDEKPSVAAAARPKRSIRRVADSSSDVP